MHFKPTIALTAALTAAGGDDERVVAAVLVYRALTYVLPVPLGGISYLIWRAQAARRTEANVEVEVDAQSSRSSPSL